MTKIKNLKSVFEQYRKPAKKLFQELDNQLLVNQIPDILDVLNKDAELKFKAKVESGGNTKHQYFARIKTKKDIQVIGFDTEDNSQGVVHLLIFYDGFEYYIFYNKDVALFWLIFSLWKADRLILWAVNMEYDLNNLCWGENRNFLINRVYNKSRFIMAKLYHNPSVVFYDAINFYSLSAEKVAELFGLKKLNFDFNRKLKKDGKVIITKKEITYCKRDTEIAFIAGNFIIDKFSDYDIYMSPTIASTALQIYLTNFDPVGLSTQCISKYYIDNSKIYDAYYGGRVECFGYGFFKDDIKFYDINSLYPYVMKKYLYPNPCKPAKKLKTADISNGIIHCTVKVPNMYLPPLPLKKQLKIGYKLLFPTGTFTGTWTIAELNNALNFGVKIIKVFWSYEFVDVVDLFSGYIDEFYNLRLKTKSKADSYFYKTLMNSLYGKFAEKRHYDKYVDISEASVFDPIVYDKAIVTESYLPSHNNVILSAYVTSYARIELYNILNFLLDKKQQLLYCDTDSIIYKGNCFLTTSLELGGLKKESDIKQIELLGAKYYRYMDNKGNWFYVCKGVPKMYQELMFTEKQATYKRPIRFRESIRRKRQPNVWIEMTKREITQYDKRKVLPNGNTKPINIK